MRDRLLLEDVRFYGQHGLTRAERAVVEVIAGGLAAAGAGVA